MKEQIIISELQIVKEAINFFTAEHTNKEKFEEIKRICIPHAIKANRPNGQTFITVGNLSTFDFLSYLGEKKLISGAIKTRAIELLLEGMVEHGVVSPISGFMQVNSLEPRYRSAGDYTKFLYDRDLILNVVCGWKYIIDRYKDSVLKIQHKDKSGDYSIGTGFYYAAGNEKVVKYLIITNKHVIEKATEIKVFSRTDKEISYKDIKVNSTRDLAFIELNQPLESPIFHFNPGREIFSEIITIGYPSVPMTKLAYQIYHKGEINSFVEDYRDNQLFLFSAKTSSGNSGSPIIDKYGMVIGIVTEELFEQEQFYQKGKLPYYAGIPTDEIIKAANENVFV